MVGDGRRELGLKSCRPPTAPGEMGDTSPGCSMDEAGDMAVTGDTALLSRRPSRKMLSSSSDTTCCGGALGWWNPWAPPTPSRSCGKLFKGVKLVSDEGLFVARRPERSIEGGPGGDFICL